jgi:hypothetical protein
MMGHSQGAARIFTNGKSETLRGFSLRRKPKVLNSTTTGLPVPLRALYYAYIYILICAVRIRSSAVPKDRPTQS